MKKFLLPLACFFMTSSFIIAQDDCMALFPTNQGATLVNKTYDAENNFMGSIIYKVMESYETINGQDANITFAMTDASNNVIDQGKIDARCEDGSFYLKMINRALCPEAISLLVENTELVGNFLDYPNTFASDDPLDPTFKMDGGEFTIRSKSDKKDLANVRVYGRNYEKNEKIITPAGNFDASKITFDFDVTKDGKTETYKGVEWYAAGAGIVRSETYDKNNNLINFTELTTLEGVN